MSKIISDNITIIIPTLSNNEGVLRLASQLRILFPLIIVDNAPDEQKEKTFAQPDMQSIKYLPQEKNIGFAAAVNVGAKNSVSSWLCIMNDDISLSEPQVLLMLTKYAQEHSWIAVSPILQNSNSEIENLGYSILPQGKIILNFEPTSAESKTSDIWNREEISGLTAACLLIRRDVFIQTGLFDESFFAYLEDVDLFLRLKKKGFQFGVDTTIRVEHHAHTTSNQMKSFKQRQDLMNWFRLICKHWDAKTLVQYGLLIIIERLRNISGLAKSYLPAI